MEFSGRQEICSKAHKKIAALVLQTIIYRKTLFLNHGARDKKKHGLVRTLAAKLSLQKDRQNNYK